MASTKANAIEHEFTLVLTGVSELTQKLEDALFEAGCDDGTITARSRRVFLTFSRAARSLKDAILSAIRDVRKANVGADVLRVDVCHLVTQADIARRIGRSRQLVHQYVTGVRGPGGFPPPACVIADEAPPCWDWCEVADWLRQNDLIEEEVYRTARAEAVINSVLGLEHQRRLEPGLTEEVVRSLAKHRVANSA